MEKDAKEKIVKDIGTALADIQKRSDERKKIIEANDKVLKDKRTARMAARKNIQSGDTRLAGLATFASTTGRKTT
jgi:hypothetical protein